MTFETATEPGAHDDARAAGEFYERWKEGGRHVQSPTTSGTAPCSGVALGERRFVPRELGAEVVVREA